MLFENLHIFEISSVTRYTDEKALYPMKNSGRLHCGFVLNEQGVEYYHFKDRNITVPPGTMLFIPKGEAYTIDMDDELNISLCINFECFEGDILRPFKVSFDKPAHLRSLFTDTELLWKSKKVGYKAECMSILHKIIARGWRQEFEGLHPDNFAKIKPAADYLEEHFADPDFKISRLYALSDLSPKYFGTLFKKQFGVSPKEYAIYLKIERAKELLLSERLTISDIGEELGFSDLYHFSKVFKEKVSFSPSEYRELNR